jgi:hypothetical protein
VGAYAAGGAVAGAIAGATGGASLLADAAVGAGANVLGGATTRALDNSVSPDDILDPGEISADALAGFVGGGVGHVASEAIHEPQDLGPRPRNGRRRLAKYDASAAAESQARNKAFAIGTVIGAAPTHSVSYFLHNPFDTLNLLLMSPQNQHPNEHVTSRIVPDSVKPLDTQ